MNPFLQTAADFYSEILRSRPVKTGDEIIDELLGGGLKRGFILLLYGSNQITNQILMNIAVNAFLPPNEGGNSSPNVVYIDGTNRFNPHYLTAKVLSLNLGPRYVLNHILLSRVFTWSQMVEILEEKISKLTLDRIHVILISGLLDLFADSAYKDDKLNDEPFRDLYRIFGGLKRVSAHSFPIIAFTGPPCIENLHKPLGGKIPTHFANVIMGIFENDRQYCYYLAQHPFCAESEKVVWKRENNSPISSDVSKKSSENLKIESFIQRRKI